MTRDEDHLRKIIRELGFSSLEDNLMRFARPSIRVYTRPVENEDQIPIGQSKIGGRPDLPADMAWVQVNYYDGQGSLPFIAQFNLSEVKRYDKENLLPEKGMLYFFADPWAPSFRNHGRVVFFDGDLSLLERKAFPDDIPQNEPQEWGERYDPCAVEFVPEVNLPFHDAAWQEPKEYPEDKTWEDFYTVLYAASYTRPPHSDTVNRLLGYNYSIPSDMQLDCELITSYGHPYNIPEELISLREKAKGNWQLLFQMDSDINAGMMWNDSGCICFYIRHEDLRHKNFDDVCLTFFTA